MTLDTELRGTPSISTPEELLDFVQFAVHWGRKYLGSGGPSSRLEEKLTVTGSVFGVRMEVYATPTGLFVSAHGPEDAGSLTLVERVKESNIQLVALNRLERLIESVAERNINLHEALQGIEDNSMNFNEYSGRMIFISAFVLGVSASISTYGDWRAAFFSGVITFIVYFVANPLAQDWKLSGIFCDFSNSVITLILSAALALSFKVPPEEFAIGSFILMVPGITLTIAISELADHDFVSGTSKMMKGILTLLAMGTAYVLFQQTSAALFPHAHSLARHLFHRASVPSNLVVIIGNILMLASFSVIFQVPRRALLWAILIGLAGWATLSRFENPRLFVVAAFVASFTVGLLSLAFGRFFRQPSQVYSVPGILTLVPGMLALSSFRTIAAGNSSSGVELAFRVALIAGAIAFGLFSARIPFQVPRFRKLPSERA